MNTLGIYISVPFCRSKCSYCNFASGVFPDSYHQRYVDRLIDDICAVSERAMAIGARLPRVVDSIYMGGGTPSLLAPDLLRRLFAALRSEFAVSGAAEITLECAPGQIEDDFLAAMLDCGVNRVSFGVQSFIDKEASVTGRLHTRKIALRDIERVRSAGIPSINVDLIAGMPHQTADSWKESLTLLTASGVDHASIYMLEVDGDSRLGREVIDGGGGYHAASVPSDDLVADLYLEAVEVLSRSGIRQYEISNFARPGAASLHNRKYWLRQPYVGFGLDAHSMLRTPQGEVVRFQTGDDLQTYLVDDGFVDVQPVARQQALEEAWFLGLRLIEGVSLADMESEFGRVDAHAYDELIQELVLKRLVDRNEDRIRLTERGRLLSNEVFEQFLRSSSMEDEVLLLVD